jgi:hypothetical protein
MVYGMTDGEGDLLYYEPHMARMYNEWVINNTDPYLSEEVWNVMIILNRASSR